MAGPTTTPAPTRVRPTSARGQATYEAILAATARLLNVEPVDRISTNVIARAANVNIASLYKYFQNKDEILETLHLRYSAQRMAAAAAVLETAEGRRWQDVIAEVVDSVAAMRREAPGSRALRAYMWSLPQLQARTMAADAPGLTRFAAFFNSHGAPPAESMTIALFAFALVVLGLDGWQMAGFSPRLLDELKVATIAYLSVRLSQG